MPSTTTTEGRIGLRDGRRLGYAEYGDPHGRPIFYFHGFHGSRLEAGIAGGAASRMGARIVAPDRPGYGLSDFKPGRAVADWPDDAIQLADAMDIDRFAVLGVSGGGPYALACALKVPQRLTTVGVLSGLGPPDAACAAREMALPVRIGAAFGRKFPLLVTLLFQLVTGRIVRRHAERIVALISARSSAADTAALARPDVRPVIIESLRESVRPGGRGVAWDLVLYSRPWGFRLGDISMPVHLWHGEADTIVPPAFGRYQADAIPHCRAEFFPGEGHISVGVNHADEILRALSA